MGFRNMLTARQIRWLNDPKVSSELKSAFLAKGEPGTRQVFDRAERKLRHCATVRGAVVDPRNFDEASEALEAARAALKELRKKARGVTIDEVSLGIDGGNLDYAARAENGTFSIGRIIHLGAALACRNEWNDLVQEALEDVVDYGSDDPIWESLRRPREDADADPEAMESAVRMITDGVIEDGVLGFLVQVEAPIPTYMKDSSSFSYSWGHYAQHWVYGETFDEAFARAEAWAKRLFERHREGVREKSASAAPQ